MSMIKSVLAGVGALTLLWIAAKELDAAAFAQWGYAGDTTDGPTKRSGLGLRIDALTGCQYLVSPYGGIHPRVDAKGRHICTPDGEQAKEARDA